MKFTSLLIAVLFSVFTAQAQDDFVTLTPGTEDIKGVNLATSLTANIDGVTTEMGSVAAGLRVKYVVFAINVYTMQVFSSAADTVSRGAASLESLANQDMVSITLDFLRDVDADTVQNAFLETLAQNDIDTDSNHIVQFLDTVADGGDADEGTRMTFVLEKAKDAAGMDKVYYQDPEGEVVTVEGPQGFTKDILSMWYGSISSGDKGLAELKEVLIKE